MEITVQKGKVVFGKDAAKFGYIKGTAKWAHILQPNQYDNYAIDLYGPEVEEHIERFEELLEEAKAGVEDLGKKVALAADPYRVNEETGEKYLQFKLPKVDYEGKPNKVKIFDVYGKEVTDSWDKLIGNGSVVKIKYRAKPYYTPATKTVGISYRFYAIQVIDLVEYSAGESGFGDESAPFDTEESEDF